MFKFDLFRRSEPFERLGVKLTVDALAPVERSDQLVFAQAKWDLQRYFDELGVRANPKAFRERKNLYSSETGSGDVSNNQGEIIHQLDFEGLFSQIDKKVYFKTTLRENAPRFALVARHELVHWSAKSEDKRIIASGEDILHSASGFSVEEIQIFPKSEQGGENRREPLVQYIEGIADKAAIESGSGEPAVEGDARVMIVNTILDTMSAGDDAVRKELWRTMLQDYIDGTTHHFKELIRFYADPKLPRLLARIDRYKDKETNTDKGVGYLLEYLASETSAERRKDIATYLLSL